MPKQTEVRPEPEKIFVKAYDVASTYDLTPVRKILEEEFKGKILEASPLLAQFGLRKMVAVFDYGSIVFFDVPLDECRQVMDRLRPHAQRISKFSSEDEFTLNLVPYVKKPEGTNELFVRKLNRDIALVVGTVLSRSVSLEYYERLVANALAQLEQLIASLQHKGKIPHTEKALTKRVGFALAIEHELAHTLSVFDDPDIVWNGGKRIEELYRNLKGEFDLEDRIKIIQQKLSLISRSSTFIISRLEGQRSVILEWIIILLILLEILLVIFGKM